VDNIKPLFNLVYGFANIITRTYLFLFQHHGVQYTTHQIADAIEGPRQHVNTALKKLEQWGMVSHPSRYTWEIID